MSNPIDHLVWAVPDLAAGVEEFARRSGLDARPGGRHPGRGTANFLLGLGGGRYLEIIGPDPDSDVAPALFGLDRLRTASLVTWAVRTTDIDGSIVRARAIGYDPGYAESLSRQAGDTRLEWRLTRSAGVLPFLIDWGDSTHPASTGLPTVDLVDFTVLAADTELVRARLGALDSPVPVAASSADGLRAVLSTPRGQLTLES